MLGKGGGRSAGEEEEEQQRWSALLGEDMGEADYESLPSDNLWQHLLAGGMAGVMEHCFMYPVDCVKVQYTNRVCVCVNHLSSWLHTNLVGY